MSRHSILVIGCGSIGERHLRCFQKTGRATVTACDNNAALLQRVATTYNAAALPDWQEALRGGQFNAAVICTPAPLHIPMGRKAMESGLHVLIEKPLSHSLEGVADLLRVRDVSGRQASVAYVFHLFPMLVQARAFVERGELGPILQAVMVGGQPFHRLRPGYAHTYYRDRRSGGGAIQDALTHSANWIESVIGPADTVVCDCAHQAVPDVDVEDTVHVTARHGRVLASYALNQFQAPNETTIQLNAARGSVKIDFHQQRWGVFRDSDSAWTWHDASVADRDAHFVAQANAFLDQLEGKPSRLCTLEAAAQTLRFNLAALVSAEKGVRVDCREVR